MFLNKKNYFQSRGLKISQLMNLFGIKYGTKESHD